MTQHTHSIPSQQVTKNLCYFYSIFPSLVSIPIKPILPFFVMCIWVFLLLEDDYYDVHKYNMEVKRRAQEKF